MGTPSQTLVLPYFVQFHGVAEDGTNKAFAFLVTHEGSSDSGEDQRWGAVWCDDPDNGVGLSPGWNARQDIGRGGPGQNASWSLLLG